MDYDLEHLEMELIWHHEKFDEYFMSNGEVAPDVRWIDLFKASLAIIEFQDKIYDLRHQGW